MKERKKRADATQGYKVWACILVVSKNGKVGGQMEPELNSGLLFRVRTAD